MSKYISKHVSSLTKTAKKQRYTLVFHPYIGHGGYLISFKRVCCKPSQIKRYEYADGPLHFVIRGWPHLEFPDGHPWFEANTARESCDPKVERAVK